MKSRLEIIIEMKKNEDNKEVIKNMLYDLNNTYSGSVYFSIQYDGNVFNNKYSDEYLYPNKDRFIKYLESELNELEKEMDNLIIKLKEVKQ